jgi:hypothetical protein
MPVTHTYVISFAIDPSWVEFVLTFLTPCENAFLRGLTSTLALSQPSHLHPPKKKLAIVKNLKYSKMSFLTWNWRDNCVLRFLLVWQPAWRLLLLNKWQISCTDFTHTGQSIACTPNATESVSFRFLLVSYNRYCIRSSNRTIQFLENGSGVKKLVACHKININMTCNFHLEHFSIGFRYKKIWGNICL